MERNPLHYHPILFLAKTQSHRWRRPDFRNMYSNSKRYFYLYVQLTDTKICTKIKFSCGRNSNKYYLLEAGGYSDYDQPKFSKWWMKYGNWRPLFTSSHADITLLVNGRGPQEKTPIFDTWNEIHTSYPKAIRIGFQKYSRMNASVARIWENWTYRVGQSDWQLSIRWTWTSLIVVGSDSHKYTAILNRNEIVC